MGLGQLSSGGCGEPLLNWNETFNYSVSSIAGPIATVNVHIFKIDLRYIKKYSAVTNLLFPEMQRREMCTGKRVTCQLTLF